MISAIRCFSNARSVLCRSNRADFLVFLLGAVIGYSEGTFSCCYTYMSTKATVLSVLMPNKWVFPTVFAVQ